MPNCRARPHGVATRAQGTAGCQAGGPLPGHRVRERPSPGHLRTEAGGGGRPQGCFRTERSPRRRGDQARGPEVCAQRRHAHLQGAPGERGADPPVPSKGGGLPRDTPLASPPRPAPSPPRPRPRPSKAPPPRPLRPGPPPLGPSPGPSRRPPGDPRRSPQRAPRPRRSSSPRSTGSLRTASLSWRPCCPRGRG